MSPATVCLNIRATGTKCASLKTLLLCCVGKPIKSRHSSSDLACHPTLRQPLQVTCRDISAVDGRQPERVNHFAAPHCLMGRQQPRTSLMNPCHSNTKPTSNTPKTCITMHLSLRQSSLRALQPCQLLLPLCLSQSRPCCLQQHLISPCPCRHNV